MVQLVKQSICLGVVLAAVGVVSGVVAAERYGPNAYQAALVAGACVWLSGSLALALLAAPQPPTRRVASLVAAILLRMGLPIAVGIFLGSGDSPLASGGLFGQIVVLYIAGLVVETPLILRSISESAGVPVAERSTGVR